MKTHFNLAEVRKALGNITKGDISFAHDDGTYLYIDGKVIKPTKGGLAGGDGDDFVEYIQVKDILSLPKKAISLVIVLTDESLGLSYTIKK